MDKPVLFVISAFFVLGGFDYIFGNRLKLGGKFEEGFKTMGTLSLGIVGIYSLSPIFLKMIAPAAVALSAATNIDPSILPGCIFPVDMGGYQLAGSLAANGTIGRFSGIVIASSLGTVVGFTIPVACSFVLGKDRESFARGAVIGMISIPPGCFLAGLISGISFPLLVRNMAPILLIVFFLVLGLTAAPSVTLKCFIIFGKIISAVGILGLLLQGLDVVLNIRLVNHMVSFRDTMLLVGRITLILAGAYPLMEILNRLLKHHFEKIGSVLHVNGDSVAAILGNLASNLLVFGTFEKLGDTGKVLCTALGVSASFILGGQLAYISSVDPVMTGPFFLSKIFSGAVSVVLALCLPYLQNKMAKLRDKNKNGSLKIKLPRYN